MYFDVLDKKQLKLAIDYFVGEVEKAEGLSENNLELCLDYVNNLNYLYTLLGYFPEEKLTQDDREKIMAIMAQHGLSVEELCNIPHPIELS